MCDLLQNSTFRENFLQSYSLPLTMPVQIFAPQWHRIDQVFGLCSA